MARIRSIHPGIWTDEAFMSLSVYARLLYIGLWSEAYDDGVFEWKPLTLKARLFPVDSIDVPELLTELIHAGLIARAERQAKQLGLIRNFQRFQRPKKPNSSGMLEEHWRDYVGASSEPVPNQCSTGTENPPQMEDEGGIEDSEPSGSGAPAPVDPRQQLWSEGVSTLKAITGKTDGAARQQIGRWCRDAGDDCAVILSKIQTAQRERIGDPVPWITAAIKPRDKPPKKITHASMWTDEAIAFGIIDEPASTQDRRLGPGLSRGHDQGPDFARRITGPGTGEPADRESFLLPRA